MKIINLIMICYFLFSCTYEKVALPENNSEIIEIDSVREIKNTEGYVVGFDPCTIRHPGYDTGYVIISTDLNDTLLTYNFPERIFNFPKEYFANFMNSGYFPASARYEYKVYITYYVAKEDEKKYLLCSHDFNQSEFINAIQIIIQTAQQTN